MYDHRIYSSWKHTSRTLARYVKRHRFSNTKSVMNCFYTISRVGSEHHLINTRLARHSIVSIIIRIIYNIVTMTFWITDDSPISRVQISRNTRWRSHDQVQICITDSTTMIIQNTHLQICIVACGIDRFVRVYGEHSPCKILLRYDHSRRSRESYLQSIFSGTKIARWFLNMNFVFFLTSDVYSLYRHRYVGRSVCII